MTRATTLCLLLLAALGSAPRSDAADFMFRAEVSGKTLEGKPLIWDKRSMALLGRDGQLYEFAPSQAKNAKKTSPSFRGYSSEEMRQQLYEEFGTRFGFTSTGHYLVAHPRGEGGEWARRFEDLYRTFVNYFRVRGFSPIEPPYPLVAVVFPNRSEYQRYVTKSEVGAPTGALGHYEPASNRVYLYDQSTPGDERWAETASTVIHEATHQTAYNVGVHRRFSPIPRWVSEGLATMFEARGVYDARSYDRGADRINRGRLYDLQNDVLPNKSVGTVASFVSSNQMFDRKPISAYAQAWALTYFLAETRPQAYSAYLERLAARPLFQEYSPAERVADFRRAFGGDLELLDSQFVSFAKDLR